ncbi:MAG: DEAD/DEAH box helicase [Proteobacteria bacterium]|nr:DEAD/DEAH box helicase [Pseudomonadota bacterium]
MRHDVISMLGAAELHLVERLGLAYVVEEIEKVIHDCDVQNRDNYLKFDRRGRRIQLSVQDREAIWAIYDIYQTQREKFRIDSWEFMRMIASRQLVADKGFPRYNALFVDEVQDLSLTSRRLILNLVHDCRFLLMTDDPAQSIYVYPPRWKDVDAALDFRGRRSFILRRNYRSTKEIYRSIESLRLDSDDDTAIGVPVPQFTGPRPTWMVAPMAKHAEVVANAVRALNKHYPLGNMGVIVRTNDDARRFDRELRDLGIAAAIVNRDKHIDLGSDTVHLITAHSAKGLEFPVAIVPGISDKNYPGAIGDATMDDSSQEAEDAAKRLLYVALSRACRHLVMITDLDMPSRFERELDPDQWEHAL